MDFLNDLAFDLLSGLAYGALGLVLLALGYGAIDLLTPGRLSDLIYRERNWNAAAVVASGLVAIATINVTAIITSHDDLDKGLAYAGSLRAARHRAPGRSRSWSSTSSPPASWARSSARRSATRPSS